MVKGTYLIASAQLLGASCLLGILTVMPPARGTMLLQPVGRYPHHGVAAIAIAAGAFPMGRSATGALIVRGDRIRLAAALLPHAIIPLAAPERFCSPIAKAQA